MEECCTESNDAQVEIKTFRCLKCNDMKEKVEVEVLECGHVFCLICLNDSLRETIGETMFAVCSYNGCSQRISDNVIRRNVSEDLIQMYDKFLMLSVENCHKCVLPECDYVLSYEQIDLTFDCPRCGCFNCVSCNAAHRGMSCHQYKSRGRKSADKELAASQTRLRAQISEERRKGIIEIDSNDIVPNDNPFTCIACCQVIKKGEGVLLRSCFHNICRPCLRRHLLNITDVPPKCLECQQIIRDREARGVLSEDDLKLYETILLNYAKRQNRTFDNCRNADCHFMYDILGDVNQWDCPLCVTKNCVLCNTIHVNETCEDYQKSFSNQQDIFVEEAIRNKTLMRCLTCKTLIQKNGGCNYIKCCNCGAELCWITQKYFRGPEGCNCTLKKRCHPDCGGCAPDIFPRQNNGRCNIQ